MADHRRLVRPVALGLIVAGLAAPAALALQRDLRSPDSREAAAGRGTVTAPEMTVVKVIEPSRPPSDSIDWGDAAIGAGGLLGLILLGLGGTLTAVHHRKANSSLPGPPTAPR